MSVALYDLWHKTHPKAEDKPCRCSRGKNKLYPSSDHGKGLRWQVRWTDPTGKPKRRSFAERSGDNPELHAEAFAATTKSDLDADRYIDPALGNATVREYGQQWRAALPSGDPNTMRGLDGRLAYICNPTGPDRRKAGRKGAHSPIADLPIRYLAQRPDLAQQWIKWLEDIGLTNNVINGIVFTASSLFVAAVDSGAAPRNPFRAQSLIRPVKERTRIVPWTLKQVAACAQEIGGLNERCGNMPYLGAGAGLRQGELFGLAEEDIDIAGRNIHVHRQVKVVSRQLVFGLPKRGKIRDVPLSDSLAERLEDQLHRFPPMEATLPWGKPDGKPHTARLLFLDAHDKPWHTSNFTERLWNQGRHAAGVPADRENGTHVLRHTFASACLAAGVDVRTLAEYLGHSDPGFTLKVYAHLMPSAAERTRKALDAFFSDADADAP
jgi:integrase